MGSIPLHFCYDPLRHIHVVVGEYYEQYDVDYPKKLCYYMISMIISSAPKLCLLVDSI